MSLIKRWASTSTLLRRNPNLDLNGYFDNITTINDNALAAAFYCSNNNTNQNVGTVSFPNLKIVKNNGLNDAFVRCNVTGISFPKLTTICERGMEQVFQGCTGTFAVSFPELVTIEYCGLQYAFDEVNVTSVSFPKLTTIGRYGMQYCFISKSLGYPWSGIVSPLSGNISFPKLTTVEESALYQTFGGCTRISSTSFPKLTTIGVSITGVTKSTNPLYQCFYKCTGMTAVHFPRGFNTYSQYLTKECLFGGTTSEYCNTNLQILFDF